MPSNGYESTIADSLNNAPLRGISYTGPASIYVKLHTGLPGAAGTANPASNTTRQAIAFDASSGGVAASASDVSWVSVPASETYTNFSLWDDVSAGNFLGDGLITSNPVTAGDTFTISAGTATFALNTAS